MADRLLVLGWHNVTSTWFFPSAPGAAIAGLRRQIALLRRVGNIVPLEPALDDLAAGRPLPARAIALTFDDGYRDNLEVALPMLKLMGTPATFFLVPGLLDRSVTAWWELVGWAFARATRRPSAWRGLALPVTSGGGFARLAVTAAAEALTRMSGRGRHEAIQELVDALRPEGRHDIGELFLDWDGARALAGRASVGSHSLVHHILGEETAADQHDDLREARRRLEEGLATPVTTLAYPNGSRHAYRASTVEAARSTGYRYALTTVMGWHERGGASHEIRRFALDPCHGRNGLRALVRQPGAARFWAGWGP